MSGLYCADASSVQCLTRLVEPSTSTSEKRCVSGAASKVMRWSRKRYRCASPRRSASAPVCGSSTRVVTPAVSWCASDTRSTPLKALSVNIDSKLKSFAAASKFGSPAWSRNGVFTYSTRGSSVCRTLWPNQRVSRSKTQALSMLKLGIRRDRLRWPWKLPLASGASSA